MSALLIVAIALTVLALLAVLPGIYRSSKISRAEEAAYIEQCRLEKAQEALARSAATRRKKCNNKPSAEFRKAMAAIRHINQGWPMTQVASSLGYADVTRLQKAISKHGKAAKRKMADGVGL